MELSVATILLLQTGGGFASFIPIIAFFLIFYFLFIMPQRKEQKRHREMLAALKVGDEVITAGGIVGDIVQLKEDRVTLKSADTRLIIDRGRIARLVGETKAR